MQKINEKIDVNISKKSKNKLLYTILIIFLIIISILLYSRFIATTGIIIKEYKITNSTITDNFHGLKIVHLSDIHYGRTINTKELENLISKVNLLKPDIVVLTGDLIDKDTNLTGTMVEELSTILGQINTKIAKYAIIGNHDYKFSEWSMIIENSGFIDLNNTYDLIYKDTNDYMLISGMSTNLHCEMSVTEKLQPTNDFINSLTENTSKPVYKILLIHEPDFITDFNFSNYDLILAGHSHNGQIRLPLIGATILPNGSRKYYKEYYKLDTTDLYISSGLGTSTLNFRLFNRPSFNFYRLTNK